MLTRLKRKLHLLFMNVIFFLICTMKKLVNYLFCLFFWIFLSNESIAQSDRFIDSILNNRIVKIPVYEQPTINNKSLLLKVQYARALYIDTPQIFKELHNADIFSIDLVFTDFPAQQSLKNLNKRRFQLLRQTLPFLQNPYQIRWKIVRQTNGKDRASAEKMLHGFVINYRIPITDLERKSEMEELAKFVPPVVEKQPVKPVVILVKEPNTGIRKWNNRRIKGVFADAKTVVYNSEPTDSILKLSTQQLLYNNMLEPFEKRYYSKKDSLFVLIEKSNDKNAVAVIAPKPVPISFRDSTILNFFKQHQLPNTLIVADVTASMTPYNAQLLHILKDSGTAEFVKYVVCFNDGDRKSLRLKTIGETGGIYGEPFTSVQQVGKLMLATMDKGDGGDSPENPVEAIIKGLQQCSTCENVVMIADNWAFARDIELVNKIQKPVHVIISGKGLGVNTDYATIAYRTKGGLYFSDAPAVTDFSNFDNKKNITIRGLQYVVDEKGFVTEFAK